MTAEWGCGEVERGDDDSVGVLWVLVLERDFEFVGGGGGGVDVIVYVR